MKFQCQDWAYIEIWIQRGGKYMKITKYPQSCLMIETRNKRILIDAGG